MSRLGLYIKGVASSYLSLVTMVVYSLVSLPLALNFFPKEQFGLWALLTQFVSYMWLIDCGMSPSIGRLLIERKDEPNSGAYGSLIQTGILVTIIQGGLLFITGVVLAAPLSSLARIPPGFHDTFCSLVRWQSLITAIGFATRMPRNILYAHQRNDLINHILAAQSLVALATLWLALHWRCGVLSILWANAVATLFVASVCFWYCARLRLFPISGSWSRPSWLAFKKLFTYGKDVFVVQVGGMLTMTAQPIIVSRCLGLGAVTAWWAGTKAFFLLYSLIFQAFDISTPALSEMMVRREGDRLRHRFVEMIVVSEALSAVAAVIYAASNSLFVSVWTHGQVSWAASNDALLGLWMVLSVLIHANGAFIILTKRIAGMRYVYLIEGIVFIVLASLLTPKGGLPTMIGCSLFCSLCFSGSYGIWRINQYFQFRSLFLERLWLVRLAKILALLVPVALATCLLTARLVVVGRLILCVGVVGIVGGYLFLSLGIPPDLKVEIIERAPVSLRPLLRMLIASKPAKTA